jgi:hypothetical protein
MRSKSLKKKHIVRLIKDLNIQVAALTARLSLLEKNDETTEVYEEDLDEYELGFNNGDIISDEYNSNIQIVQTTDHNKTSCDLKG